MIKKFKLFEKYLKEDPKGIFKIGDRVICNGIYQNINYNNNIGTVISFYTHQHLNEILIKFDERSSNYLHGGDNAEDPTFRSSYVKYELVKHYEDENNLKIKWFNKGKLEEKNLNNILKKFNLFNINKKIIYYTQNFIDENKVNKLMEIITSDWIKNNPVAFEVYENKLYLTEGHHRFEACLRLNNKEILNKLFETAYYYNINYKPIFFKKKFYIIKNLI